MGVVTSRDKIAIQWTTEEMRAFAAEFVEFGTEAARSEWTLPKDSSDWKIHLAQQDIRDHSDFDKHVVPIQYRPFDHRFTYYTGRSSGFICRPRSDVMQHMLAGENLGICIGRAGQVVGSSTWDVMFATRSITDLNLFRRGGNCLFPLYLYESGELVDRGGEGGVRNLNLDPAFLKSLQSVLDLSIVSHGRGDGSKTLGPADIFDYIYAVLYSPTYRRRYSEFLKSDFPRIPITGDVHLFSALAQLGCRLTRLHLMETIGNIRPDYPMHGDHRVVKVSYSLPTDDTTHGKVWINQDQYFEGIDLETWRFTIGGYCPVQKWLKDRKARILSVSDIEHYQNLCAAISETRKVMTCIDKTIESHGGWPLK